MPPAYDQEEEFKARLEALENKLYVRPRPFLSATNPLQPSLSPTRPPSQIAADQEVTQNLATRTKKSIAKVFIEEARRYHDKGDLEMAMKFYRRTEEYLPGNGKLRLRYVGSLSLLLPDAHAGVRGYEHEVVRSRQGTTPSGMFALGPAALSLLADDGFFRRIEALQEAIDKQKNGEPFSPVKTRRSTFRVQESPEIGGATMLLDDDPDAELDEALRNRRRPSARVQKKQKRSRVKAETALQEINEAEEEEEVTVKLEIKEEEMDLDVKPATGGKRKRALGGKGKQVQKWDLDEDVEN